MDVVILYLRKQADLLFSNGSMETIRTVLPQHPRQSIRPKRCGMAQRIRLYEQRENPGKKRSHPG